LVVDMGRTGARTRGAGAGVAATFAGAGFDFADPLGSEDAALCRRTERAEVTTTACFCGFAPAFVFAGATLAGEDFLAAGFLATAFFATAFFAAGFFATAFLVTAFPATVFFTVIFLAAGFADFAGWVVLARRAADAGFEPFAGLLPRADSAAFFAAGLATGRAEPRAFAPCLALLPELFAVLDATLHLLVAAALERGSGPISTSRDDS
jgi:hypothetical protein